MVIAQRTFDTNSMQGQLECVADMFAMPADNLSLTVRSSMQQVLKLNLSLIAEASKRETTDEQRAELLRKLGYVNRGFQMVLQALELLEGTKGLAQMLVPPTEPESSPAPPIVRQSKRTD